jgi:hypothetical protein
MGIEPPEPVTAQTRVQAGSDLLFSRVGDESVLLNLKSGVYFSLDPVGTLVWAEIIQGKALGEVQRSLFEQFAVDSDVIWADLVALVTDLVARDLVTLKRVEE